MQDKFDNIVEALKNKACVKQEIYRNSLIVFEHMKEVCKVLVDELAAKFSGIDESVAIEFHDVNQFEFQVKFSGDMLVFNMHSNIVTFPDTHILFKSPYIQEDARRKYFGHIMVYNFMADSIRYNRLNDPGYLLARLLLNVDQKFYIEGLRPLNILHSDVSQNDLSDQFIRVFIEHCMLSAIETDLHAPGFQQIQVISLGQKVANQMVAGVEKVGFDMDFNRENQ